MSETIDTAQWGLEVLPTKERLAKRDIDIVKSDRGGMSMRARDFSDVLMYYARNGFITFAQRRAGQRFQGLFFLSGVKSRYVLSRYCEIRSGEPVDFAEIQEAYKLARAAIKGKEQQKICFNVCCIGEKAGSAGGRGNMNLLRAALNDLAKHFGYEEIE